MSTSAGGIVDSLAPGAVHISCSTISVALATQLARAHADAGQLFVSAPVFGRPEAAGGGEVVRGRGGRGHHGRSRSTPLLDAIGQRTFVVSESPEAANLVKLSGNFLIASVIESLGEAMALVHKAGVDKHQYLEILTSTLFDAPVYRTYGGLIADEKFDPAGFAAPLGLKDIRLVLEAGEALRGPTAHRGSAARPIPDAAGQRRRGTRLVGHRDTVRPRRRRAPQTTPRNPSAPNTGSSIAE